MIKTKTRKRTPVPVASPPPPPRPPCLVPGCGRRAYVGELCQTHHRQMLTRGTLTPIRAYRPRTPGTQKFAGLRLTSRCVERIQRIVAERGLSASAAISEVLDDWAKRKK